MYSCPSCDNVAFSFWHKSFASDLKPRKCPSCGAPVALSAWASLITLVVTTIIVGAGSIWAVLWNSYASYALAIAAVTFAALVTAVIVHYSPLVSTNATRRKIANAFRWVILGGGFAWFVYAIASEVVKRSHGP